MRPLVFVIIGLLILVRVSLASAQTCEQRLDQIKEAYRNGSIDDVVAGENPLENCLRQKNLSREDEIEAYKYLTIIYLYLNRNQEATTNMQSFMRKRLKSNPDYSPRREIPESGIPEFIQLFYQLRYWPTFYWGGKMALNFSNIRVNETFSVDRSNLNRGTYESQLGFQLGASFEIPVSKSQPFFLVTELFWSRSTYRFQDRVLDFAEIDFLENQDWISLPILCKYYLRRRERRDQSIKNRFQPFAEIGGSVDFLLRAQADVRRVDNLSGLEGGGSRDPIEQENLNLISEKQRKRLNYFLIFGAGLKLKNFLKTGGDLLLSGRYHWGLGALVNQDQRYANPELIYNFGYVDSDIKLNLISLSIGFLLPNYNPQPTNTMSKPSGIRF